MRYSENIVTATCLRVYWLRPSIIKQDAQLSQRDRAAGCVIVSVTSWKTGTGKQYFTDII